MDQQPIPTANETAIKNAAKTAKTLLPHVVNQEFIFPLTPDGMTSHWVIMIVGGILKTAGAWSGRDAATIRNKFAEKACVDEEDILDLLEILAALESPA